MENTLINYVEFKAKDLEAIKKFYTVTFGWKFTDYGTEYIAFADSGIEGGFQKSAEEVVNGALIVLYHSNLEDIRSIVLQHGGKITQDIYSFPGGRRFHFIGPAGNELAIWSDKGLS
ncbi:MAG TPA: VOC family protein [Roseivirga sp.]